MSNRIRLSRAEIEIACLLQAVGQEGCTFNEYLVRLGLSPTAASVVREAFKHPGLRGLVELSESSIALTEAGLTHLTSVGVAPLGSSGPVRTPRRARSRSA